jgi:hypothetical protein
MAIDRTAYLVAFAYLDPTGRMLPQIHGVSIFSESARSLSVCPRDTAALDVYEMRDATYQEARDRLAKMVHETPHFAWCSPLMKD